MNQDETVTDVRLKVLEKEISELRTDVREVCRGIENLKENHLEHLNSKIDQNAKEQGEKLDSLACSLTSTTTDMKWIKLFVPLIVGAAAAITVITDLASKGIIK